MYTHVEYIRAMRWQQLRNNRARIRRAAADLGTEGRLWLINFTFVCIPVWTAKAPLPQNLWCIRAIRIHTHTHTHTPYRQRACVVSPTCKAYIRVLHTALELTNCTLAVHERVDSRFLVLPGSESTITEITESNSSERWAQVNTLEEVGQARDTRVHVTL